uniref:Uncharacterized protein n=1 Tax=Micrurus lemniscatus lemniscatus TaxID=129467 RepID=A0A2D4JEP5_MICLE
MQENVRLELQAIQLNLGKLLNCELRWFSIKKATMQNKLNITFQKNQILICKTALISTENHFVLILNFTKELVKSGNSPPEHLFRARKLAVSNDDIARNIHTFILFIYLFIYNNIYILPHLPKDSGR